MRFPSKKDALKTICEKTNDIKSIIDIGVLTETRDLIEAFPNKKHFLVEPIEEYYETIRENYKNINIELFECAASNKTCDSNLELKTIPGGIISHSHVTTKEVGENIRPIKCITLDELMAPSMDMAPFLMKIDVDGHEISVLEGASKVLEKTNCLIIECPLYSLQARMAAVKKCAPHLELWDMVDFCYWKDNLWQVDLIFLSSSLRQNNHFDNTPKVHTEGISNYTCL